jgi:hypothetical protein
MCQGRGHLQLILYRIDQKKREKECNGRSRDPKPRL